MKKIICLFSLLGFFVLLALIPVANAEEQNLIQLEEFHISIAFPAQDQSNPYCTMAHRFKNGLIIIHSRNNRNLGSISFDLPDFSFDFGKKYQINIQTETIKRQYAAEAKEGNILIAKTGYDQLLFNALENGESLSISLDDQKVLYKLESDKIIFKEFSDCLKSLVIDTKNRNNIKKLSQPLIPLSKPINPAQISLEKTTHKKNVRKSSLLFDDEPKNSEKLPIQSKTTKEKNKYIVQKQIKHKNTDNIDPLFIEQILSAAKIDHSGIYIKEDRHSEFHWFSKNSNISGHLSVAQSTSEDFIERALKQIRIIENRCEGEFISEIGLPEKVNVRKYLYFETHCHIDDQQVFSAHIFQEKNSHDQLWTQSSYHKNTAFTALKQRNNIAAIINKKEL